MLEDFLGHGIFNSDGESWKWQRATSSTRDPSGTSHNEIVERLLPSMRKAAEIGETLDFQQVLERFSFDNICKVAFSEEDDSNKFNKFFQAFEVGRFLDAFKHTWRIKKLLNVGSERKLKESISVVHDYAMDRVPRPLIPFRRERGSFRRVPEGHCGEFPRRRPADDLVWFFWVLSNRPDVQEKITEEVKRVRGGSEVTFSYDEPRDMHYLHAAVTESMRLFPPVAVDTQSCLNGDTLPDGTFVGKGWFVTYSAYAMGRMESIWGKDCEEYRPERWLDNGVFRPESPFRYPVFHAGPRMCLGKEMAYIQMKSVVACILQRFQIHVVDEGRIPQYDLSVTMRMKGGLPVKVTEKAGM